MGSIEAPSKRYKPNKQIKLSSLKLKCKVGLSDLAYLRGSSFRQWEGSFLRAPKFNLSL